MATVILLLVLIFLVLYLVFCVFSMWADFKGAPFVPTNGKLVNKILEDGGVKKGSLLIDLGCGEGRVAICASKEFGVMSLGVDLNPFLVLLAKFRAKLNGVKTARFVVGDLFKTDISKADYIFLFLMPKTLMRLSKKLEKESKRGTVIIAHGFEIKGWERKPYRVVERNPFPTYYYKIS